VEATGGLELNWVHTPERSEQNVDLSVYQLNPNVLRTFVEQQLHVSKTDTSSTRPNANYLRGGLADDHTPHDPRDTQYHIIVWAVVFAEANVVAWAIKQAHLLDIYV